MTDPLFNQYPRTLSYLRGSHAELCAGQYGDKIETASNAFIQVAHNLLQAANFEVSEKAPLHIKRTTIRVPFDGRVGVFLSLGVMERGCYCIEVHAFTDNGKRWAEIVQVPVKYDNERLVSPFEEDDDSFMKSLLEVVVARLALSDASFTQDS